MPVNDKLRFNKMNILKFLVSIFLSSLSFTAFATVELSIIIPTGYVAFVVEDHWSVLNMQTKLPVTASVFQIPNKADEGTPDSTNLIISVYEPKSPKALNALKKVGKAYGPVEPRIEDYDNWKLYWQKPKQGETVYSLVDARRDFNNTVVTVRLAWPHLERNEVGYDVKMDKILRNILSSIREHNGPWTPKGNQNILRSIR